MKISTSKIFFSLLLSAVFAAQTQGQAITITAADMPVPSGPSYYDDITALVTSPTVTENGFWDYSDKFGNLQDFAGYYPETIPFFTNAGIDLYRQRSKYLNSDFVYFTYQEYDFNAGGVYDAGLDVLEQRYSLAPITGNPNDSLIIAAQSYLYNQPLQLLEFPMTAKSTWSSNSRRTVEMTINVPAFGLNNAPLTHAFTWVRQDSIVGWGKVRVYTPNGPSIDYDVLIDKSSEYAVDSFYLAGAPAPSALLSAFGVAQGQHTQKSNRLSFYRKGSYSYLVGFQYNDDAFTDIQYAFVNTDNIETATASAVVEKATYATILYPNPSAGSEINVKVLGSELGIAQYRVTDLTGRTICQGKTEENGDGIQVHFNELLSNGQYFITLMDKDLRNVLSEKFEVTH